MGINGKRLLGALLAIVIFAVAGVIIFFQLPQGSIAKVEPSAPSYIGSTRIFLLSAKASYGYADGNPFDPCFVVHATIRDDFTSQNPVDTFYNNSQGSAWFIMSAELYDKNDHQITYQFYDPGNLPPNWNEQGIAANETETVTITMLTSDRNVDHYTLVFAWLGTVFAP